MNLLYRNGIRITTAAKSIHDIEMASVKNLCCVVLVLLILGSVTNADENYPNDTNSKLRSTSHCCAKDANDPNERWWSTWDAVVSNPNDANELLRAKLDAATIVLQNKKLAEKLKEKIIDKIMSPIFDFDLMAKLVLGRAHWSQLTAPQHKKFTRLFTKRLKSSYLKKISLYKNEKALLKPAVKRKHRIYIPMLVLSSDRKIAALYKLRRVKKRWKIYDVEIQGVSIILTYRSQFNDVLRRGSVKDLFSQLEKPATK